MNTKLVTISLVIILLVISLFTACNSTSTTSSTQSTTTQSVTSTQISTTTSAATQANWWDKFGEPEYGGTLTLSANSINNAFDPYNWQTATGHHYDYLWNPDWTEDRSTELFTRRLWMPSYWVGNVAESWEWENALTLVVHLRQDVTWQNKTPVNGRQFTAYDVVWHYDRMLGTGNGFSTINPYFAGRIDAVKNVTARDNYTVVFNCKNPAEFMNAVSVISEPQHQTYEASEVWAMGKPISEGSSINSALNDWQNIVGIGPYMMTDFVASSTMVETRNPDYWNYDERYPENKLPYIDTIKTIYISDTSTSIAALRTGKIDILSSLSWQQAKSLNETSSDLQSQATPTSGGFAFMRCDTEPFTDINVRKAMNMALDRPSIAEGYFGGYDYWDAAPTGFSSPAFEGWAIPFAEWSQSLKDEYTYNPDGAKQLLADAGYPNGFSTTCLAGSSGDLQLLQVMKAYWSDINVDVEINTTDQITVMQMMMAKKHDPLTLMGGGEMPPQMGLSMLISTEPTNATVNNDPVFDEMVADILTAASEADAKQAVIDADMYMLEHHWLVMTFNVKNFTLWQSYLDGYSGEMLSGQGMLTYSRIWVDSALKESMGR